MLSFMDLRSSTFNILTYADHWKRGRGEFGTYIPNSVHLHLTILTFGNQLVVSLSAIPGEPAGVKQICSF